MGTKKFDSFSSMVAGNFLSIGFSSFVSSGFMFLRGSNQFGCNFRSMGVRFLLEVPVDQIVITDRRILHARTPE